MGNTSKTLRRAKTRFWSSVEYDSIMAPIVRELQALGYDAEHLFLISSFDYRAPKSEFARIWLRFRMYVLYPAFFVWKELRTPSTHCIICTNTFYTPFLSTLIRKPNRKTIHLLYDLFPDVLVSANKIRNNNPLARGIRWIVDTTIKNSDANVILGKRLKAQVATRLPAIAVNHVIPVGTDCNAFENSPRPVTPSEKPTEILYCGNFGHLHEVDTLIKFFAQSNSQQLPVKFRFHGIGAGMKQLKEACPDNSKASFASGLPASEWAKTMSSCPVGLVTMRVGAEKVLMPSKTYSAMAAGQAILAICPRESDLADMITGHDCGWVIEPGDIDRLTTTIKLIASNTDVLQRKRNNAQQAARRHYDAAPVAKLWSDLLSDLLSNKCQTL